MRSDPKRVGHAEEKEKKEAKGHSALSELKQESHSAIVRKRKRHFFLCSSYT